MDDKLWKWVDNKSVEIGTNDKKIMDRVGENVSRR